MSRSDNESKIAQKTHQQIGLRDNLKTDLDQTNQSIRELHYEPQILIEQKRKTHGCQTPFHFL